MERIKEDRITVQVDRDVVRKFKVYSVQRDLKLCDVMDAVLKRAIDDKMLDMIIDKKEI